MSSTFFRPQAAPSRLNANPSTPFWRVHGLVVCLAAALISPSALAQTDSSSYDAITRMVSSGQLAQALKETERQLTVRPRDPQLRFLKGVIQSESGDKRGAIASFQKLTEDHPELPEPYNNLAVLYADQRQLDKARATLEAAIRTNPSYATAHENLGDIYAMLASEAYSKALQHDGGNTAIQPKLNMIRGLLTPGTSSPSSQAVARPQPPAPMAVAKPAPSPAPTTSVALAIKPPAVTAAVTAPVTAAAPATIAAIVKPQSPTAPASNEADSMLVSQAEVEEAVQAWARAWSTKDVQAYLASYGPSFVPPENMARNVWEEERRVRIEPRKRISVGVQNLKINVDGNQATARFRQIYASDTLNVNSSKTLQLVNNGQRWLIVREISGG
jgi:tetratricopeptide (TPR) repeat protein